MARGRMIDRAISTSKKFAKTSIKAQWLYMRILPFTDDHGRVSGDVWDIKHQALPAQKISEGEIEKLLIELHDVGLIKYAQGHVVQFERWDKHQTIGHRPAESKFPEYQAVTGIAQERSEKVTNDTNNIIEYNLIKSKLSKQNFETFWLEYPKKVGKKIALNSWMKIDQDNFDAIMTALKAYKKTDQWKKDGGQYIPNPSTWLNQERWNDELTIKKPAISKEPTLPKHACSICGKEFRASQSDYIDNYGKCEECR